jgi:pimeloyl-ACP methyl ester carboxylesterase
MNDFKRCIALGLLVLSSAITAPVHARPAATMVSLPTGSTLATWKIPSDTGKSAGTVVFLHGGPGLYTEQRRMDEAAVFRQSGYTTLFFDQAGSGQSQKLKASDYSLARAVADLEALRQSSGLDKMLLWGNSYGAILAMLYAQQYPDRVSGFVLTAPGTFPGTTVKRDYSLSKRSGVKLGKELSKATSRIDKEGSKAEPALSQIETGKLFDEITQSELLDAMTCKASTVTPQNLPGGGNLFVNRMLQAELKTVKRDWSTLPKVPALIVRGACDFLPVKNAETYKTTLNAEFVTIPNTGHALLEDRTAVDRTIAAFLMKLKPE